MEAALKGSAAKQVCSVYWSNKYKEVKQENESLTSRLKLIHDLTAPCQGLNSSEVADLYEYEDQDKGEVIEEAAEAQVQQVEDNANNGTDANDDSDVEAIYTIV